MSVVKKSLPILVPSFINKCGEIGLNLLPMILIERNASASEASIVLTAVTFTLPVATFLGGWFSDRTDSRTIYLWSFGLSAIGLSVIPFAPNLWMIALFGIIAQVGKAFYTSSARMMLSQIVGSQHQKEALGWFRTGNNMGQIVSYSLGTFFAGFGTTIFFVFDGITSFVGFLLGKFWFVRPNENAPMITSPVVSVHSSHPSVDAGPLTPEIQNGEISWNPIARMALVLGGFNFLYELFALSLAATCKINFGADGLKYFSMAMMINTILCTIFAVPAAKYFTRPFPTLFVGLGLVSVGGALAYTNPDQKTYLFLGMFVVTVGEIIYSSLSQYVMMSLTKTKPRPATAYAAAMSLQTTIRALSGAATFPLIVHGPSPSLMFLAFGLPFLALLVSLKKLISQTA
jgi:MFS family permease